MNFMFSWQEQYLTATAILYICMSHCEHRQKCKKNIRFSPYVVIHAIKMLTLQIYNNHIIFFLCRYVRVVTFVSLRTGSPRSRLEYE